VFFGHLHEYRTLFSAGTLAPGLRKSETSDLDSVNEAIAQVEAESVPARIVFIP